MDEDSAGDVFRADKAWALVAGLTAAYMISRGLAEAGSEGGPGSEEPIRERSRGGASALLSTFATSTISSRFRALRARDVSVITQARAGVTALDGQMGRLERRALPRLSPGPRRREAQPVGSGAVSRANALASGGSSPR